MTSRCNSAMKELRNVLPGWRGKGEGGGAPGSRPTSVRRSRMDKNRRLFQEPETARLRRRPVCSLKSS